MVFIRFLWDGCEEVSFLIPMRTYMKNTNGFNLLVLAVNLTILVNCSADDLVIGRFDSTNYGDWKLTGTAFNPGPAGDDLFAKLEIENARDNRVASREMEGDGPTGTLTLPEFKIARKYISFLISGGDENCDDISIFLVNRLI